NGLLPDRAQYNGHHSTDPKFGHLSDGSIYPMTQPRKQLRGAPEAIVDLPYQVPQVASYVTSTESWRYLAVWDPWISNGGWYWQLFNSAAPDTSNLVSIFAGPVSRALSPGMSGACIFTLPSDPRAAGRPVSGISSQ